MKMDLGSESLCILGYKPKCISFGVCVLPSKWFYHLPDITSVWMIQTSKGLTFRCVSYYTISPVEDKKY